MHQKGITLIELIIVLAIVAVIILFAMQDNSALRRKNESEMLHQSLITALGYAKMIAVTGDKAVCLRPLDSKNWAFGMAMYRVGESTPLYQWQWKYPAWELSWQGFGRELIIASNPQNASGNGHFVLLHKRSGERQCLQVNRLGRIV